MGALQSMVSKVTGRSSGTATTGKTARRRPGRAGAGAGTSRRLKGAAMRRGRRR